MSFTVSRKERLRERRLLKDFNIDLVETVMEAFMKDSDRKNKFSLIRRLTTGKREKAKKNWNAIVGAARAKQNPIGKTSSFHSGSLKELREKVLQEQELPPMRGAKRFAHAARRVLQDKSRNYENVNNIAAIEEEIPGTFSASVTPRNSIPQDPIKDETDDESINKTHYTKNEETKIRKSSDIVVDIENDGPRKRTKRIDSCPPITVTEIPLNQQPSNIRHLITQFDDGSTDSARESDSEIRRHSEPTMNDKNLSEYLTRRRNAKIFPEFAENTGWL